MPTKVVTVPNISCGHCVDTIEREVAGLDHVIAVNAELGKKTVSVTWNEPQSWDDIKSFLTEINYPPED